MTWLLKLGRHSLVANIADIVDKGIVLAGGGAFLRPATARLRTDLDQRRTSLARCWSRIYQRLKERAHRGAALPHHPQSFPLLGYTNRTFL